ncbi:unnamed protein product [Brassica oleracea var. botrytis]
MEITHLFLDEKDSMIHRFIPAGCANHYCSSLIAGSDLIKLTGF